MSRRRYQRGSLKDDGDRWEIRYRIDVIVDAVVKRPYKWDVLSKKEYPTKRMAQRELERILAEVNREDYKPLPQVNFAAFAKRWQETILIHHKQSSRAGSIIKVHLLPAFGDLSLKDITAELLQAWVSQLQGNPKSIRNRVVTLKTMWATAKAWGYVTHDPFNGLILPKEQQPITYAFSLEETIAIIAKAQEPWKTLIRIVAETGIRSGEVAGLRIEDFDPVNLTLGVSQSVWRQKIQTVKTRSSVRKEPISAELAQAIQEHINGKLHGRNAGRFVGSGSDCALLFTERSGKPLHMTNFLDRVFRPILEELGIRKKMAAMGITKLGLHGFRRMSATQMDEQNVPIKTRLARMGHGNNPKVLMSNYTKPIDAASRKFADTMGALLAPRKDEAVQ
jgi:integrase